MFSEDAQAQLELRAQLDELIGSRMTSSDDPATDARALGVVLGALGEVAAAATEARYRAVDRLRADGASISAVADALGISRGVAQRLVERSREITPS